ncbi:Tyrosine-protein kinase SYK-like [Oopsacas minuta]|uniref:Tyrosine-protein kinase SYK-like n=1 Tax=Oopsacas minuta TaxID=111878 RepID=A0AAV7K6C5_9METZ|nr:Tyrosine-protein kinase SYK-like [Oopsacas minuta]
MTASSDDSRIPGFYGRMTRTEAEGAIRDHGALDGQYLIRICPLTGKYSISLSAKGNIFHYLVKVSPEGLMSLSEGRNFSRFKDLIEFYSVMTDGIETTLSTPCPKRTELMKTISVTASGPLSPPFFPPTTKLRSSSNHGLSPASADNTPNRTISQNYLWYHGRISRQESEEILNEMGTGDDSSLKGCFLVRDNARSLEDFVLSLHAGTRGVVHYHIQKEGAGEYSIDQGDRFSSPIHIVTHYKDHLGGLITKVTKPCLRKEGVPLLSYKFVPQRQLTEAAKLAAIKVGVSADEVEKALLCHKRRFHMALGSLLTQHLSWFHGAISREEAERKIKSFGLLNGLFIIREKAVNKYALCLVFRGNILHYLIHADGQGLLSIEDGELFYNLIQVVDHYSKECDGLMCRLSEVCPREDLPEGMRHMTRNLEIQRELVELKETLGIGNFGSVMRGILNEIGGKKIECAVKMLKTDEVPNRKVISILSICSVVQSWRAAGNDIFDVNFLELCPNCVVWYLNMYYCIYLLFVISTVCSISIGRDFRQGEGRYGRFERDTKGTDVISCPYFQTYTECNHRCTVYCDSIEQKPFLNCGGLIDSFFAECQPGCVCPSDQYETTDGYCVYYEEICDENYTPEPPVVGEETCEDPNMIYSECHPSCITTCRNFFIDGACAAVCFSGCRCKEGYVMDEATSQCTLPANCTMLPELPRNTMWGCCEGDCSSPFSKNCESCNFGPQCKPGFVRDNYGDCVDYEYCQEDCGPYEIYDECPYESTCLSDNSEMEDVMCVPGCQCQGNYVRDHISGDCILPSDCPIKCTGAYEIPGCSACSTTCDVLTPSMDCSSCEILDTCVCDTYFAREGSDCVLIPDCSAGVEELCNASRNQIAVCSDCISTCDNVAVNCYTTSTDCDSICGCTDGYVLNEGTGECVLPSKCPTCTECESSSNSQTYKDQSCLPLLCIARKRVSYDIRFVGTWDQSSHPDFGFPYSHWSPLTGASHKPSYEIWENCFRNVTTGVSNVAERGDPTRIIMEYATHPEDVLDTIENGQLLPGYGEITRSLNVNKNFHYITLLSMMGDTMDYMVGVDRLDMCDHNNNRWKDYVKVCLNLYSTGTKTDIAPGCSSHSRQFSNCTFGYIELTRQDDQCTGSNEEFTKCYSLCDVRCEHLGGLIPCPRACIPGCRCISGYARNEKDECIPESDCSNEATQPNKVCEMSEWTNTAFAVYPDYHEVTQIRYLTQRPTRKYSAFSCPSNNFRIVACEEGGVDQLLCDSNSVSVGCAVWYDTCYVESKCSTTDAFDEFYYYTSDELIFEPVRTHEATTVRLSSLDLLDNRNCVRVGDLGQHTCQWETVTKL